MLACDRGGGDGSAGGESGSLDLVREGVDTLWCDERGIVLDVH